MFDSDLNTPVQSDIVVWNGPISISCQSIYSCNISVGSVIPRDQQDNFTID